MNLRNTKLVMAVRILLGLELLFFGVSYFFMPMQVPDPFVSLTAALVSVNILTITKVVEAVVGLMLLTNKYVPLAVILMAPISVGIIAINLSLAPAAGILAYVTVLLNIYLGYVYWDKYKPLFA